MSPNPNKVVGHECSTVTLSNVNGAGHQHERIPITLDDGREMLFAPNGGIIFDGEGEHSIPGKLYKQNAGSDDAGVEATLTIYALGYAETEFTVISFAE